MNVHSIGLPAERYTQLQNLAARDGQTIADVIGDFINEAIFESRLDKAIPGWRIERQRNHVLLVIDETNLPGTSIERRLSFDDARAMAQMLDRFTVTASNSKGLLDLDTMIEVRRVGSGLKIIDVETQAFRSVSRSIARDLADLLACAAK